jgi:hypothetical protein
VRARLCVSVSILIAVALPAAARAGAVNPCAGPEARHLLCPDLRIGPPSELYVQHTGPGHELLHATSDVRSRGRGPIELRGRRNGRRSMRVNQAIYRVGGGRIVLRTGASLHFTDVGSYFGGSYWKVHGLARFELRRIRSDGQLGRVVRTGPKLNYCLRDLDRTKPGPRSPSNPHYPGCNQDPHRDRVTLGTSVGWSDIYPADYDRQWINVAGLRGCFAFTMTVDPQHFFFESNEHDNTSMRRLRLPFTGKTGC